MDPKTLPYQDRLIRDITTSDLKVAISGTVIATHDTSFVLDDGTGHALVTGHPPADFVRVFGRVIPYENGFELHADIIQDYSDVDKTLLASAKALLSAKTKPL